MLVATLVNIDALERSSTLGRLVSEQVAARFAQQGRAMVELKLRHTMYMRRTEGELALTREIAEVARQHNARAILLGSYGLSGDMVFVNLKVVQPGNNLVLAAYDYALPLNREVRSLLGLPG
jgi:TolB-like protein